MNIKREKIVMDLEKTYYRSNDKNLFVSSHLCITLEVSILITQYHFSSTTRYSMKANEEYRSSFFSLPQEICFQSIFSCSVHDKVFFSTIT